MRGRPFIGLLGLIEVYKMDEYQKNEIINKIAQAALKASLDVIKQEVKNAIENSALLQQLFKQRG